MHITDFVNLPGYQLFYLNRYKRGGGVAVYVNTQLKAQLLPQFSVIKDDFEILHYKLTARLFQLFTDPRLVLLVHFWSFLVHFLNFVLERNFLHLLEAISTSLLWNLRAR